MKKRLLSSIVVALALLVTVAGCRSGAIVRFPTPGHGTAGKSLPPGQAKKVYGHQSARAFAPGQQKKNSPAIVIYNDNGPGHKKQKGKKK